jgi:glycosyltransferase involved in cell wall biosynthesis
LSIDKSPLVSVLITSYNREKYIAEAIESVLNSTFTDYELIIVDDCSTDNTLQVANVYASKDARIKLYRNERNVGQFGNRNKAIELASGKYIKFLDSDDTIAPIGLETMVNAMVNFPDAVIGVPAPADFTRLPSSLQTHDSLLLHYKGAQQLAHGPTGVIFRKDAIAILGGFEPQYGILTDTLFNLKLACHGDTAFFSNGLCHWRIHDEQITIGQNQKVLMVIERYEILKAVLSYAYFPLHANEIKQIVRAYKKINIIHICKRLLAGDWKGAIEIKRKTGIKISDILIFFNRKKK